MTQKKPILDNGLVLYKDYEFLFNFLTNEQTGRVIKFLLQDYLNPILNPTEDEKVNNVYNYIASRIISYREKHEVYSEWGKKGGNPTLNPTLNHTLKGEDMGTLNPTLKLINKNNLINKHNKETNTGDCVSQKKIFKKPTVEEVGSYCLERKNEVKAEEFMDHYESNGWLVGRVPMKDWKAAVRTWEKTRFGGNSSGGDIVYVDPMEAIRKMEEKENAKRKDKESH